MEVTLVRINITDVEGGGIGLETAASAQTAGLEGFETSYKLCKKQLENEGFPWRVTVDTSFIGSVEPIRPSGVRER